MVTSNYKTDKAKSNKAKLKLVFYSNGYNKCRNRMINGNVHLKIKKILKQFFFYIFEIIHR